MSLQVQRGWRTHMEHPQFHQHVGVRGRLAERTRRWDARDDVSPDLCQNLTLPITWMCTTSVCPSRPSSILALNSPAFNTFPSADSPQSRSSPWRYNVNSKRTGSRWNPAVLDDQICDDQSSNQLTTELCRIKLERVCMFASLGPNPTQWNLLHSVSGRTCNCV